MFFDGPDTAAKLEKLGVTKVYTAGNVGTYENAETLEQGASASDVLAITQAAPELGFANVSRSVLRHGPSVDALCDAVRSQAAEFRAEA